MDTFVPHRIPTTEYNREDPAVDLSVDLSINYGGTP